MARLRALPIPKGLARQRGLVRGELRGHPVWRDAQGRFAGAAPPRQAAPAVPPHRERGKFAKRAVKPATERQVAARPRGVQERYRIRILWRVETDFQAKEGGKFVAGTRTVTHEQYATYYLTGPLGTPREAIEQAKAAFSSESYNRTSRIVAVLDYWIEAA